MKYGLMLIMLLLCIIKANGQSDTIRLKRTASQKHVVTDREPQAVYFQLGGSAPIVSLNYDRRFNKKLGGAGFAAGLGFWGVTGVTVLSVPVSVNYLIGRRTHFVELATGATYLTGSFDGIFDSNDNRESGMLYHANVGYRHQPATGGFFFRGGASPLFHAGVYGISFLSGFWI